MAIIFAIFSAIAMLPVAIGGALIYLVCLLFKWMIPILIVAYILDAIVDVPDPKNKRK